MKRLMGIVLAAVLAAACGGGHEDDALSKTTLTRLESTDLKPGTGAEARQGRRVSVHYTGWLYHPTKPDHKGRQFDSSRDRNRPFDLTLGAGEVIPGWEQGLLGMKAGGQRRIVIPPGLAYGSSGQGDIPPDATLVFDLELVTVQ
jgi:FKBP-type peptidyl-prolyl cis-trans isomerase FkpA